jgi:hypothetical protein
VRQDIFPQVDPHGNAPRVPLDGQRVANAMLSDHGCGAGRPVDADIGVLLGPGVELGVGEPAHDQDSDGTDGQQKQRRAPSVSSYIETMPPSAYAGRAVCRNASTHNNAGKQ